jgi:hypothetical protein
MSGYCDDQKLGPRKKPFCEMFWAYSADRLDMKRGLVNIGARWQHETGMNNGDSNFSHGFTG